jgi:hypothetical protein
LSSIYNDYIDLVSFDLFSGPFHCKHASTTAIHIDFVILHEYFLISPSLTPHAIISVLPLPGFIEFTAVEHFALATPLKRRHHTAPHHALASKQANRLL